MAATQQTTPELQDQAFAREQALLETRFGDDVPLGIELRGDFWRVIEALPDGSERIVYTKLDGTLAGTAEAYFEHLRQGERKQQERESLEARARTEGVAAYVLEHRRGQAHFQARRRRALAPLRAEYGYSRTLLRGTQPRPIQRERAPRRRPRAATATGPRRARSPDRPRPCECGCGELAPPGRRTVDEVHATRVRGRRHYARKRVEAAGEYERELAADREAQQLLDAQARRAAKLRSPRDRVRELADRRLAVWLALPSANGDGAELRVELDELTRALDGGWEAVRTVEAVAR